MSKKFLVILALVAVLAAVLVLPGQGADARQKRSAFQVTSVGIQRSDTGTWLESHVDLNVLSIRIRPAANQDGVAVTIVDTSGNVVYDGTPGTKN